MRRLYPAPPSAGHHYCSTTISAIHIRPFTFTHFLHQAFRSLFPLFFHIRFGRTHWRPFTNQPRCLSRHAIRHADANSSRTQSSLTCSAEAYLPTRASRVTTSQYSRTECYLVACHIARIARHTSRLRYCSGGAFWKPSAQSKPGPIKRSAARNTPLSVTLFLLPRPTSHPGCARAHFQPQVTLAACEPNPDPSSPSTSVRLWSIPAGATSHHSCQ